MKTILIVAAIFSLVACSTNTSNLSENQRGETKELAFPTDISLETLENRAGLYKSDKGHYLYITVGLDQYIFDLNADDQLELSEIKYIVGPDLDKYRLESQNQISLYYADVYLTKEQRTGSHADERIEVLTKVEGFDNPKLNVNLKKLIQLNDSLLSLRKTFDKVSIKSEVRWGNMKPIEFSDTHAVLVDNLMEKATELSALATEVTSLHSAYLDRRVKEGTWTKEGDRRFRIQLAKDVDSTDLFDCYEGCVLQIPAQFGDINSFGEIAIGQIESHIKNHKQFGFYK